MGETSWPRPRPALSSSPRRAIVVRRADQLKGDDERIIAYAEDPSPDVTLVLMAPKPDRRRKVWKQVLAKAETHSAQPKRGRALRSHVEEELRRRGLRLAPEGLEELIDRVGQDLRRLMGEVDKLEAFGAGQSASPRKTWPRSWAGGWAGPSTSWGTPSPPGAPSGSLELIDELMREGEEGLRILATLHRSLRQVRGALALREAGTPARRDRQASPPRQHAVQGRGSRQGLVAVERRRAREGHGGAGPRRPADQAGGRRRDGGGRRRSWRPAGRGRGGY